MQTGDTMAFLGTGLMGLPMARNLANAGCSVRAWNRTQAKAAPLETHGATVADTPQQAIAGASIVMSMLSDGTALAALVAEPAVRAALGAGMVWVDMSSTKPRHARECAKDLESLGVAFIDAPVSGGTKGAEDASLAIMVGGEADVFAKVEVVLRLLGRPVLVGGTGAGQLAKLANQAIVAITIGAVAEATLLLERGGADVAAVRAALKGGFADSTILQQHGARMSERDFVPGGLSSLQLKDLENVLEEAAAADVYLPMVGGVRDRFARYVTALGGAQRDHAGLFEELLDQNRSG